jgi:hypothetical protein
MQGELALRQSSERSRSGKMATADEGCPVCHVMKVSRTQLLPR